MTNTEKTLFEKIVAGEIPCTKIYEDADTFAFLDIHPSAFGHTQVISKMPYKNIHELPDEVACSIIKTVKKVADAISRALKTDGIKIVMNNGAAAGQVVFHSHTHVIPRFIGDKTNDNKRLKYRVGEIEEYAAKIRAEIK